MKTETSGLLEPRLAEAPRRRLWLALSHLLLALIMLAKVGGDFTLSAALKTLFHLHAEDTAGLTVASTDQVVGAGTVAYLMGKLAAGPTVRLVGARVASFCMLVIFLLSMITIGVGHSSATVSLVFGAWFLFNFESAHAWAIVTATVAGWVDDEHLGISVRARVRRGASEGSQREPSGQSDERRRRRWWWWRWRRWRRRRWRWW